jgi:hypothetical protein
MRDLSIGFLCLLNTCHRDEKYHCASQFGPVTVEGFATRCKFYWDGIREATDAEFERIAKPALLRHILLCDKLMPATDKFMRAEFWR